MNSLLTPDPHRRSWAVPLNSYCVIVMGVVLMIDWHQRALLWFCFDLLVIAISMSYILWGDRKSA